MTRVELALLGRPQLIVDGHVVAGLTFAKARALLFYLALEREGPTPRETLAALLWPEMSPTAARTNLRQMLAQLKEVLSPTESQVPLVVTSPHAVQLNPASDVHVDVRDFRALLARVPRHTHASPQRCAVCARWRRWALALYRGPFLDQFFVHDSASFEDWALLQRETLHAQAADALFQLAAYCVDRGAAHDAVTTLERLLALDPWHEEACRQLMVVLVATGQRSAALRQYVRCAQALSVDLDVEPEDATTLLYERIRSGTRVAELAPWLPPTDTRFPTNLPSPTTTFVGRTEDVQIVRAWIGAGGERLITITGAPGIGKTRLGLAVADVMRTEYDDGVWWVPLAEVRDAAGMVTAIARALGVNELAGDALLPMLKHYVHEKLLLLVLDNCEQVGQAAPVLAELLAACAHLTVLATSRVPLKVYGEREYRVPPLTMPGPQHVLHVDEVDHYAALRLFVERARAVQPDFALTATNSSTIVAICWRLDGLPLAIELAAARVKLLPPAALLGQLAHRLDVLIGGPRDWPRHQQTLRTAIAWSYDLLPDVERRLFRRLGVFAGGWTVDAAAAVCAKGDDRGMAVLDGLQSLVDHNLVQQQRNDDPPRFSILETVREYALEQLTADVEQELIRRHHALYFVALAEQAQPHLKGAEQRRWLERLDTEHDNMRQVLAWCTADGPSDQGLRLAAALWWFWRLRGYFSDARAWLEQVLALPWTHHVAQRLEALIGAGFSAWDHGERDLALRHFQASLALAQEHRDTERVADALYGLGVIEAFSGDSTQAARLLGEAHTLYLQHGNRWGAARALQRLTRVAIVDGDVVAAEQHAHESIGLARETGNPWVIAWSLMALANLELQHGDGGRAATYFEECVTLFESYDDTAGIAHAWYGLATASMTQGSYERATRLYGDSLQLFRAFDLQEHVTFTLIYQAYVALFQGHTEPALALLRDALTSCLALNHGEGTASALIGLSWAALLGGQPVHAAELCGAEQAWRATRGARLRPTTDRIRAQVVGALHTRLDEPGLRAAWQRGRGWSHEAAIARAYAVGSAPVAPSVRSRRSERAVKGAPAPRSTPRARRPTRP